MSKLPPVLRNLPLPVSEFTSLQPIALGGSNVNAVACLGLNAVAVQNPLTSWEEDVAATRRAVALQDGPVILVGHSYGGAVITDVGADPKVVGLVSLMMLNVPSP